MQPDVTWDGDSQQRFLDRIAAESARLGRLVDDLLDFSAIESVFVNLLNNAFGHNPPGTQVRVSAGSGPAEVAISVQDDGQGMPPELAAAPFDPARRPRASTGAGLGLSIAKGIVQAHGGMLEPAVLSKGTCFSVYLPVEGETLEARQADRRPATEAGATGAGATGAGR